MIIFVSARLSQKTLRQTRFGLSKFTNRLQPFLSSLSPSSPALSALSLFAESSLFGCCKIRVFFNGTFYS